jgi:hypothetical protein
MIHPDLLPVGPHVVHPEDVIDDDLHERVDGDIFATNAHAVDNLARAAARGENVAPMPILQFAAV